MAAEDLDEVLRIENLSFPNPWSRGQFESELRNPVSHPYALKVRKAGSSVLAAYIIYWVIQGESHILNIAVAPEYRRRGFAAELLGHALDMMRKKMVWEVFLEVRRSNRAAQNLYRKFGFKEAFERKNYYGDEDAIVMTLEL